MCRALLEYKVAYEICPPYLSFRNELVIVQVDTKENSLESEFEKMLSV